MTAIAAIQQHSVAAEQPAPVVYVSRVTEQDRDVLADVYERSMAGAYDRVSKEFSRMCSATPAARTYAHNALEEGNVAFIVRVGERPVGFAMAFRDQDGNHNLHAIGVVPDQRGQGHGALLYRNVVQEVPELRIKAAVATDFFAHMGASVTQTVRDQLLVVGDQGIAPAGGVSTTQFRHQRRPGLRA